MQSALATLDGIETDDVKVDYSAKTATVSLENANLSVSDLVAAFEGTRFTATPR